MNRTSTETCWIFAGRNSISPIDGRAGVRIALPREKSISGAYIFEHMSNAYETAENPGLDAHMISVTYRFPLRLRRQAH